MQKYWNFCKKADTSRLFIWNDQEILAFAIKYVIIAYKVMSKRFVKKCKKQSCCS